MSKRDIFFSYFGGCLLGAQCPLLPSQPWQMLGCVLTLPTFLGRQMAASRTLGGLGGIVQTAPTFKDQAGRGGAQSTGEGPHRLCVAELHKQTATAALPPPTPTPTTFPFTSPPSEDPCPRKFRLLLIRHNCGVLLIVNGSSLLSSTACGRRLRRTGCLHMYNL